MAKGAIGRGLIARLEKLSPEDRAAVKVLIRRGVGIAYLLKALDAKPRGRPKKWDTDNLEVIAEVHRLGRVLLSGQTQTIQHRNRPRPDRQAHKATAPSTEIVQLERSIRARLEGRTSDAAALEAGIRRYMVRLVVKKGGTPLTDHEITKWVKSWSKRLSDHRKQRP